MVYFNGALHRMNTDRTDQNHLKRNVSLEIQGYDQIYKTPPGNKNPSFIRSPHQP